MEIARLNPSEIEAALAAGALLVDVRKPAEIAESGSVPGALRIPIDELQARLSEVPTDRPLLTACNGGGRGKRAAQLLAERGFQVQASCGLRGYAGPRCFD